MKRITLLISLSIIIMLGLIWTGASWYTGKQVEAQYAQILNNTLHKYTPWKSKGVVVQADNILINRHVFRSQVTYDLHVQIILEDQLVQDWIFNVQDELVHGPLAFSKATKFHLDPVMFVSHTQVFAPENFIVDVPSHQPFFTFENRVDYDQNFTIKLDTTPIALNIGSLIQFDLAPVHFTISKNKNATFSFSGEIPKLRLNIEDSFNPIHLELTDYAFSANQIKLMDNLPTGKISSSTGAFKQEQIKQGVSSSIEFVGVTSEKAIKVEAGFVNIMDQSHFQDVIVNQQSTGGATINLNFNHIEYQAINNIMGLFYNLFNHLETLPQNPFLQKLGEYAQIIVENQPQLHLSPFSFAQKDNKSLMLNLDLELKPLHYDSLTQASDLFDYLDYLEHFNLFVNLDKSALEHLLTMFLGLSSQQAKLQIDLIHQELYEKGVEFIDANDALKFQIEIKEGDLFINQERFLTE